MHSIPEAPAIERTGSIFAAGRRLLAAVWDHAGIRLELFALELAEERSRLIGALVAAAALAVCVALTMAFAGMALLVAAWDTPYRMLSVVVLAAGFALAGLVAWASLRQLIGQRSPLFRHSLAEWRRDVDSLRPQTESEA